MNIKMEQSNLFKEYKGVFDAETADKETDLKEKKERTFGYSPFALQDAIGEKDVKKIWIEYQKLRLEGIDADELVHKIISKLRDMSAIKKGADKEDLGIKKDYPYNKSKRDARNWKEEELKDFYTKLVQMYHYSHMGENELDTALEKALLNV